MNKFKLVVFDLDGTLMDAGETIYLATIHTLEKMNIKHNIDKTEFFGQIGAHFADIFNLMNVKVEFEPFIKLYKKHYFDFISTTKLFPEADYILNELKKLGIKTAILTTKAQDQLEIIIKHFNLTESFDYLMGRREGIPIKPSPEPLLRICNELNIPPAETLFVGDTEIDILTAQSAGASMCSITHGYRDIETILEYKPDFVIHNLKEIKNIVI